MNEQQPTPALPTTARLIALIAGLIVVALAAVFLIDNPYGSEGITTTTRALMVGIIIFAWISMMATWYGKVWVLVVSFAIAFIPGFFLLLTPGVFAFIGVAQTGFLLAAWMIFRSRQ